MKTMTLLRLLTLSASIGLAAPAGAENLNSQAQKMFDDLGMVGNVTAPQAFKGQTLNTYTGGSLFVRTPTKNYQLANLQMPYIRAGCGGIDIFGGSFSHISGEEFKAMLKNITSAVPGVLFQMMLKSVEPLLGSTLEWFKGIETMVNRQNISSCESAKSLVSGGISALGYSASKTCETIAIAIGTASDSEQAREKCKNSSGVDDVLSAGAGNADTKQIVPFEGNLVWEQLKKWPHLDEGDKELILSLVGTTIYPRATDGADEPQTYPPTIRSVADLLYGNAVGAGASGSGQIRVKLLKCGGSDCTTVTEVEESMPSLISRVTQLMSSISDKMQTRSGAPTTQEENFINSVPTPVYRLLAASNAINNPVIAEAKIAQYAEYVAVEFAHGLLSRAARIGMDSAQAGARFNQEQGAQLAIHRENARVLMSALNAERQAAESKARTFVTIAGDIEQLERNMRANMPQQVADLMAYSGQPGGR